VLLLDVFFIFIMQIKMNKEKNIGKIYRPSWKFAERAK